MKDVGPFQKMTRAIAFGRRVPLRKLVSRIERDLRRRAPRRSPAPVVVPPLAARPPLPLFAPRHGRLERVGDKFLLIFLGQSFETGPEVDWRWRREDSASQLWRMNLHYMEYLEEVDDALFTDLARQWIGGNLGDEPECWKDSWNSYSLSLRVVVWMQQLAARRLCLSEAAAPLITSLASQICHLEKNLETDLGGNHLVKNIKALIWASAFFAGPMADRWRALGTRLLIDELARQIPLDGVHYERSPSYHCQVFADVLECRRALGVGPSTGRIDEALERMAQATADLAHPDGGVALFNDAGLSMSYEPGECLEVYARLFGSRPTPQRVFAYPQAGYFGLRNGADYFVADFGRIGPDDLPAHAHGDIGSFEWSVAGERIFVDQGVFEYVAGEKRRRARSAANHNTLCFENADQADFFSAFRCGRRPDVNVRFYDRTKDRFVLEGSHNGFANLPAGPIHVRRLSVRSSEVVIRDRIEPFSKRAAALGFLLHPEAQAEVADDGARIRRGGIEILMSCAQKIEIERAVWWPDMGCERETRRLRVRLGSDRSEITTILRVSSHSVGA
ncbi:heparinase II/III family protein [Methylosinus sporium]|uniref:Uncharacterized protein n=2 Tax=Methylosinus sporium TaxID=428 RepID=A0A2U1SU10_METSR|nr:hypothetical protein C5689_04660 [Methylosinus sporium]